MMTISNLVRINLTYQLKIVLYVNINFIFQGVCFGPTLLRAEEEVFAIMLALLTVS